jgi:hypothetical protein
VFEVLIYINLLNVILSATPPNLFLIWVRTRTIGNNIMKVKSGRVSLGIPSVYRVFW